MLLADKLKELKLTIVPVFNIGVIRDKAQWFVGREFSADGTPVQLAWFGDWRQEQAHFWRSHEHSTLSAAARKKVDAEIAAHLAEHAAEELARHETVAKEAEEMWNNATDRGDHPYIGRKKINGLNGARLFVQEQGHPVLLVPMRDTAGRLWNITRIYSKKFEGTGSDKFIIKGGRKQGLFHSLGEIHAESTVYITEGFATGCSVFEATGRSPTIICFDAGNLESVSRSLREAHPGARLVFAADNDLWTKRPDGSRWNPGREKALKAASLVGGSVILPRFTDLQLEAKPTDFNDLAACAGVKEVAEQLANPLKAVQEVVPLMPRGKGAKARVSEKDITESLVQYFDGKIVAFETDLFRYTDNHWKLMGLAERNRVKQLIGKLAPEFGSRDITAAFNYFLMYCPTPPQGVNLFQPNRFAANFANGTLHLSKSGRRYVSEFRAHAKDDWLTYCLPFPYHEAGAGERNVEFDQMLQNVWQDDSDQAEKIRLYKQILGACLVPAFPIIVMFVGPPETGKSTLIKIAKHLVADGNWCSVDPSDFHGFKMASMIGKLVNLHTDIDTNTAMRDNMVKRIIDSLPVEVERKHLGNAQTFLPSVHLFGANNLPKTNDGASRAYDRRIIILRTDKFQPKGNYDKDFDTWVWEQGPGGIIAAAIEGLADLLESNGHYHKPESGKALVKEMQDRSDPVAMFLEQIKQGQVKDNATTVKLGEEQRILKPRLWAIFDEWRKCEERNVREMGRTNFYRYVAAKGYQTTASKGADFVHGIGTEETTGSQF